MGNEANETKVADARQATEMIRGTEPMTEHAQQSTSRAANTHTGSDRPVEADGFTLYPELVKKVIRYYAVTCGRQVDVEGVRMAALGFTGSFRSSSECVDAFRCEIWNKGLVR